MPEERSVCDAERDRIADNCRGLPPFTCAGCRAEKLFPATDAIRTAARYRGRLRADVAAIDAAGRVSGVVEVAYYYPPTEQVLEAQESLGFAYYRMLRLPWRKEPDVWLCCPECWSWCTRLPGGGQFTVGTSPVLKAVTATSCPASSIPAGLASIGLAVPLGAPEGCGQNGRPKDHCSLHRLQFRSAPVMLPSLPERDVYEHSPNSVLCSTMHPCQNRGPANDERKTLRIRPGVGG